MKKLLKLKISNNTSGKFAEFICRMYMRFHGYKIIAKNYRCGSGKNTPYGEIDFIALRKNKIIFCEVKKRKSDKAFWSALSATQQQRILRGGMYFMRNNPKYSKFSVQYDVFWIKLPFNIKRIKNALYCDKLL